LLNEQLHIFDIAGRTPLYFTEGNAVKVKVKDFDLSVATNILSVSFPLQWQRNETLHSSFGDL
jgi:hypothetical protein